jgi:RecA-family ATPase
MIPNTTKTYLQNGATNGSRNQSLFDAACQMRDAGHSQQEVQMALIQRALMDGLDIAEANKTLISVFKRDAREEPKGNGKRNNRSNLRNRTPVDYKTAPKGNYSLKKRELPQPIDDGASVLLRAAFEQDENVRIVLSTTSDSEKGRPDGEGTVMSREWWLDQLGKNGGNFDSKFSRKAGVYIGINPMKIKGSRDEHVTKYRHALVEFDDIETMEEQWFLINETQLPCTAVMTSGNKSLHAWVKVDAKNRAEFDQRMKMLCDHLEDHIDSANKNPSRLSRLPNSMRFDSRQELLALNIGAKNWTEWENNIQADSIGERIDLGELVDFDTKNDPSNILGDRWLCKGGSCLFVGQSGIGKSSLCLQLAINWALGRTSFGIRPERPLKSLIIQAENDRGDVAEMVQGSLTGMEIKRDDDAFTALQKHLVIVTESVTTGEKFTEAVRHLIGKHKPDLVWLDPLLSFIGDDISRQDVCSYFLRNLLNPIAFESGVTWMMMHHTPKPSADPKSKSGWNTTDHSYAGTGSAELTNWARAVCLLRSTKDEGRFQLVLAKRGKRAGATTLEGGRTSLIHLKHADDGILWEQTPEPIVMKPEKKARAKKAAPKPKLSKEELSEMRKDVATKNLKDVQGLVDRITEPMNKKEIQALAEKHGHGSAYLVKKQWSEIESLLVKTDGRRFQKP